MEGVGPRQARSSRFGPSAAAAVFSGPVRKWKRKWVQVSSSPSVNNHRGPNYNSRSQSNGRATTTTTNANSSSSSGSRLILCRWTPLSTSTTNGAAADTATTGGGDEPRKRKFRYTPIVVLEEQRKAEKKLEDKDKTSELNQFMAWKASENDDEEDDNEEDDNDSEQGSDDAMKEEIQEPNTSLLDLGLGLKGHKDVVGQRADDQVKKANSRGIPSLDS